MESWLRTLDSILRGEATRVGSLRDGTFEIPLGGMTVLIVLLGIIYGFGMGSFALFKASVRRGRSSSRRRSKSRCCSCSR